MSRMNTMPDSMMADAALVPVVRDTERFKLLFTNGRPRIPEGKPLTIDCRSSSELIEERMAELKVDTCAETGKGQN